MCKVLNYISSPASCTMSAALLGNASLGNPTAPISLHSSSVRISPFGAEFLLKHAVA